MSDFTTGAHECFCDRQYKDANKLETCGDCPRDYIAGAWDARRKYIEEHSKMTGRQRTHSHDHALLDERDWLAEAMDALAEWRMDALSRREDWL